MAKQIVKSTTFRRVRSDDYISVTEQQTKETTAAVLVEILQDQTKKQNTHHNRHPQPQASTLPFDGRPRSLGDVVAASCVGTRQSRNKSAEAEVVALHCQEGEITEHAKLIANRLRRLGDAWTQRSIGDETLREMTTIIASPQPSPADSERLSAILGGLTASLNLTKVFELFVLLHQLIRELVGVFGNKPTTRDRRWGLFQDLLEQAILRVTQWICSNGGWQATVFATIRSRGNSFVESPPPSPSAPPKARGRVFSLSEDGEFKPTSWETHSACELSSGSPSRTSASPTTTSDPREEWCNIAGDGVTMTMAGGQAPPTVSQTTAAIPVPSNQCGAGSDSPFDRFRSGSLPANRRERHGLSRTSQIALTAYSTVAFYLSD